MTLLAILVPLAGVIAAPFYVWGWGFGWTDLALLLAMYFLTALGITVGFHRLFVHRSFETYPWVKFIWGVLGSMAVQGSLFTWVGLHRRHHQYSDTALDPHSPRQEGTGILATLRGFWHAHIGWFFRRDPELDRYLADLKQSRMLRAVSALFPLWVALGLVIPAVVGGVVTQTWSGAATGLIWGGLVRMFLVHHVTWCVNSACHLWGAQPYASKDDSRNNALFGVLAMGGVAQHPSCIPDIGATWPAVVADRRQLLGNSRPSSSWVGVEPETSVARGAGERAAVDVAAVGRFWRLQRGDGLGSA